jgi:hypothetical protein
MFEFFKKPAWQFATFLLVTAPALLILDPVDQEILWSTAGIIYGVFILCNSLMILTSKSTWRYFWISLGLTFLYPLAAATIILIYSFIFSVTGPRASSMGFLIAIYHPFTLGLVILLEWIFAKTLVRRKI